MCLGYFCWNEDKLRNEDDLNHEDDRRDEDLKKEDGSRLIFSMGVVSLPKVLHTALVF